MFRMIFSLFFGYFAIFFCCVTISLTFLFLLYYNYIPKNIYYLPIYFYLKSNGFKNNEDVNYQANVTFKDSSKSFFNYDLFVKIKPPNIDTYYRRALQY
ncbi:hypothetical protein MXB_4819 [Myxobolus squamalis]|nr:hypothetical protein MXB_4819 [Myxobolus squamalis]